MNSKTNFCNPQTNRFYTVDEIKRNYPYWFIKLKLYQIFSIAPTSSAPSSTKSTATKKISKKKVRGYIILICIAILTIVGLFYSAELLSRYNTIFDIKTHFQMWQTLGGVYQEDYEPYYNLLQRLCYESEWYAQHKYISVGQAMIGQLVWGTAFLANIIIFGFSVYLAIPTKHNKKTQKTNE